MYFDHVNFPLLLHLLSDSSSHFLPFFKKKKQKMFLFLFPHNPGCGSIHWSMIALPEGGLMSWP